MKLSRYIFVFLIILLLWILLIWPIDAGKLILGAGIALITAVRLDSRKEPHAVFSGHKTAQAIDRIVEENK